jgi:hypothetical protein
MVDPNYIVTTATSYVKLVAPASTIGLDVCPTDPSYPNSWNHRTRRYDQNQACPSVYQISTRTVNN